MRKFDFSSEYKKLLTAEIVALLTQIHEYRGQEQAFSGKGEALLSSLVMIARVQSSEASNRIEGIVTTSDRVKQLVFEKTMPKNRSEQEIAGYRDVLAAIHENYEYIPVKPSLILQLHRDMCKYSGASFGGRFKDSDNIISETLEDGTQTVRFTPVPAWETPEAVEKLCSAYNSAIAEGTMNPLILTAIFILDFLCIHPFNDGNGRMSRLLTLLLLYRSGYNAGKYISLEKITADTKESYYEVLKESSEGWHQEKNSYLPFVLYMLGIIIAAYRELASRIEMLKKEKNKPERIREVIKNTAGKITKSQILEKCPDISSITIQRALSDMLKKEKIIKIGKGRYTAYSWNWK